jgi:hypothetical protein
MATLRSYPVLSNLTTSGTVTSRRSTLPERLATPYSEYRSCVEYEIIWGGNPEDVCVRTNGVATLEDFRAWLKEWVSDARIRPGLRVLMDHRQLDMSKVTVEDIERRAEIVATEAPRFRGAHIALVVERDIDYGILRMLGAVFEGRPEFRSVVRVLRSIEEARFWLATCPAPEASDAGN